jgi:hypothetical protein
MNIERRVDPYDTKNAENTKKRVLEYLEVRQEINHLLEPYKPTATVIVDQNDFPLKIVHTGDTHLTHVDSKIDGLPNAVKQTGKKGILITHANLIDSVSSKFISTNTINVGLNLDQQTDLARQILHPVDKRGQLIVIGANTCHEGWSMKTSTHDTTRDLVSLETPMLYNGGQVILEEKNGKKIKEIGRVEGYHNSGKGRTKWSPEGSVRERSRETPFGDPEKPSVIIDAHMHQLTAAVDVIRDPIDRQDHITVLGEVGASKGTKDNPDRFINGLGVPPRNQPGDCGEGLVVIWKRNKLGKVTPYPVADYDRANVVFNAEQLYEETQRTGTYKEIYEEMMASGKFKNPEKELVIEDCLTRKQDSAANSEGTSPLYKTVSYDIKSNLPIRVHFIGNLLVGSSSFDRETLKSDLKNINSDPWAYYFATRRLVNQFTATSVNRKATIDDLSGLLGLASSSALGVMLTDELRNSVWGNNITRKNSDGEKIKNEKLFPGDYLYNESQVKGVPIIMPETVAFINLRSDKKQTPYTLYLRDKLSHFTSLINPYHGLTRIEGIWGIDADLLVGGHTEAIGWRTWMRPNRQLEVVVPGGYADYIEKGVSNRVDYPSGGQGAIFFPDQKRIFSFATFEEGRDMHESLLLAEGLRKLGTLPEIRRKLQKK